MFLFNILDNAQWRTYGPNRIGEELNDHSGVFIPFFMIIQTVNLLLWGKLYILLYVIYIYTQFVT